MKKSRDNLGIARIDKMRENHLTWFGHVYRRPDLAVVKTRDSVQTTTKTKRGNARRLG